jgi:hypothetical protein
MKRATYSRKRCGRRLKMSNKGKVALLHYLKAQSVMVRLQELKEGRAEAL